jgi:hypothetical protein
MSSAFAFPSFSGTVISKGMAPSSRASTSVVAAGVVAILGGSFAAVSLAASFFVISRITYSPYGAGLNPAMRPILYATWIFFLLCAIFVIVAGLHVIRLRNWARLALLVVAGCALLFGIVGLGVIFVTIYFAPADPAVSKPLLASILAFIYGLPILVALWWLVLFTRRSVADQFHAAAAARAEVSPASAFLLNNPECPLAVRIVGWYLASFILFLPVLPFLPSRLPAFYFGHVFRGLAAIFLHFLSFALLAIPGIGLLLLKRWSYLLTIATQLFFCLNCLFIAFGSSFESNMRATLNDLGLSPSVSPAVEASLHQIRYMVLLSLIIPIAILIILCVYRRPFFAAADPRGPMPNSLPSRDTP